MRKQKPSLIISALEALAVLFSLPVIFDPPAGGERTRVQVAPTWTAPMVLTPKFPVSAVLMEMAAQLKKRRLQASVQWTPRTANRGADSQANGDTQSFNPECECAILPESTDWLVLPQALERGRQSQDEFRAFRESGRDPQRGRKQAKREVEARLKTTDPL